MPKSHLLRQTKCPVPTAAQPPAAGTSRPSAAHEIRKPINQQKPARHVIAVRQSASILASSRDPAANLDCGAAAAQRACDFAGPTRRWTGPDGTERAGRGGDLCTLTTTGRALMQIKSNTSSRRMPDVIKSTTTAKTRRSRRRRHRRLRRSARGKRGMEGDGWGNVRTGRVRHADASTRCELSYSGPEA